MSSHVLREWVALSCFVWYVYFSYCDGFRLKPIRKLIWGGYFLFLGIFSFRFLGHYDLTLIIMLSSLLAFVLAWFQRKENRRDRL